MTSHTKIAINKYMWFANKHRKLDMSLLSSKLLGEKHFQNLIKIVLSFLNWY